MDFLKKNVRKSSRSLQFESLETRELLAANTLSTLTAYAQTDNPAEIRFTVSTNDAKPTTFELTATGSGTLDPSKIELRDSSGKILTFTAATDGTKTTASTGTINLAPGSYTAYVHAENGTSGNLTFEIATSLSNSPGMVYLIEAAILQQQDGWAAVRSGYTKLLEPYFGWGSYENLNTTKKTMLDLNGDGKISAADLEIAKVQAANPSTATITASTVAPQDLTAPTITLALKTGSTAGTTDPTLIGKMTDTNGIKAGSAQYSIDNGVSWTALSLDSSGNYTIPASTFKSLGAYTVIVRASDTKGNTGSASLSFTYLGSTVTNSSVSDSGTGKVSVGNGLQVQSVDGTAFPANNQVVIPGKGTVTKNADGTLSFSVDPNFYQTIPRNTTATVSVQVVSKDSLGNTHTTPVSFSVFAANSPPVRNDEAEEKITLNRGTSNFIPQTALLANWSDPDYGTALTVASASINSVTCSDDSIKTYGVAYLESCLSDQNGRITFTATDSLLKELGQGETLTIRVAYTVSDGDGANVTGYLTFVVNGVNDDPTVSNFSDKPTTLPYTISQEEILSRGNARDINANDKDKLTVSAVSVQSGSGSVSYVNGILTFTPDAVKLAETPIEQELVTVLSYTVADAHGGTTTATITLRCNGTQKIYTANAPTVTQIKIGGNIVYSGSGQTFSYGGQTINVPTINGNGQLLNESLQFVENPTLNLTSFLSEGTVAEFTVQYDVLLNGNLTGSKGTSTHSVIGENVKPTVIAKPTQPSVNEDDGATIINLADYLIISDPNVGDPHTIQSLAGHQYTGGTLSVQLTSGAIVSYSGNGLNITYDPNGNFDHLNKKASFLDELIFTITDGKTNGESTPISLNIRVDGVNNPPVWNDTVPKITVTEDAAAEDKIISFNELLKDWSDKDHPNSELNITNVVLDSVPSDALISLHDLQNAAGLFSTNSTGIVFSVSHEILRQLGAGQSVELTFSYTVVDPDGGSGPGSFMIEVKGQNDPPSFSVIETFFELRNNSNESVLRFDPGCGNAVDVDLNDDGLLTYSIDAPSTALGFSMDSNGVISIDKEKFIELSEGNYTVTIMMSDAHGGVASKDLTIHVRSESGPVVDDVTLSVDENDVAATVDLMNSVAKIQGRKYSIDTTPVLQSDTLPPGMATIDANGVFTFTPGRYFQYLARGEELQFVFGFTVFDDGFTDCQTTATITVTVIGKNDAPEIIGDEFFLITNSGAEQGAVINVTTFDVFDPDTKDKGEHTWSLGTIDSPFAINEKTGQLTLTNTNVDLEPGTSETFKFMVVVSDGDLTDEKEITVTIYAKQEPEVGLHPNDEASFVMRESEFIAGFFKEWTIDVAEPNEPFAVERQQTDEWYTIGRPTVSLLSGTNGEDIDLALIDCSIDGGTLVFQPTAGLFDFLNKGEKLTLQISFTVTDNDYGVTKTLTQEITILGEASQHSIPKVEKSVTIETNKLNPDENEFEFDLGFTTKDIIDADSNPTYKYSIFDIDVTDNPKSLSREMIRSYFEIDETDGTITLKDHATGNFECEITIHILKYGAKPAPHVVTVTVYTAETPTATDIDGSICENSTEFTAKLDGLESPGGYTLSNLTLPQEFVTENGYHIEWTGAMDACWDFDPETGEFSFTPNGHFDFLAEGDSLTLEFTYMISDKAYDVSATGTIRLTIDGVNNPPVILEEKYSIPLWLDWPGGKIYYLDELAKDVDLGDTWEIDAITFGGTIYPFNDNKVVIEKYGVFTREIDDDNGREFLRFVPDSSQGSEFSNLLARDETSVGQQASTGEFVFGYIVTDQKSTVEGTISLTIQGVNYRPQPTGEPSDFPSVSLSENEPAVIDLRQHFTDKNIEDGRDELSFSIPDNWKGTFIKSVTENNGILIVTYISSEEFTWSTNTSPVTIVVTASDLYGGSCIKEFTFSMENAQTIGLAVVPVWVKSSNGMPSPTVGSIPGGGSYFVEVWASDLFENASAGEYGFNFSLSANASPNVYDPPPFRLEAETVAEGISVKQENYWQLGVSGQTTISSGADVLLFRLKVTVSSELTINQVVNFLLTNIDIERDNEKIDLSQIFSSTAKVIHNASALPAPTSAPIFAPTSAFSAWGPTSAMAPYENEQFPAVPVSSTLPFEMPPDDEISWGTGFSSGNSTDTLFALDFDPFAPLDSCVEDYEQSLAEFLLAAT